jgi:hypothetical protein
VGALGVLLNPGIGHADPLTVSGSQGDLAATASFAKSGNNLIVTLTNTSTVDVGNAAELLTAIFFDLAGNPTLTPVSAVLNTGSVVVDVGVGVGGPTDPDPDGVGGEWGYRRSTSALDSGNGVTQLQGISSAGFNVFGGGDVFPGADLDGPPSGSPNGAQYGLLSAGDNIMTGNGSLNSSNNQYFIKNSVVFTLSGLSDTFDVDTDISNIRFQYGTGLNEPSFGGTPTPPPVPTPEPAVLTLVGLGAAGLAGAAWRKRRRTRQV